VLDAPYCIPHLNRFANDELVFPDDVETRDDIPYQILRAEPQRQAGQSRDGGRGQNVDSKLRGGGQQRHAPHDLASRAVKNHCHRARLLLAGLRRARFGAGRFDQQVGYQAQKPV